MWGRRNGVPTVALIQDALIGFSPLNVDAKIVGHDLEIRMNRDPQGRSPDRPHPGVWQQPGGGTESDPAGKQQVCCEKREFGDVRGGCLKMTFRVILRQPYNLA